MDQWPHRVLDTIGQALGQRWRRDLHLKHVGCILDASSVGNE